LIDPRRFVLPGMTMTMIMIVMYRSNWV